MTRVLPRLHVITDDGVLASRSFVEIAERLLERCRSDVALHIRGHHTTGATLYAVTERLAASARSADALLFVNDRVDIALALKTDGVQLGKRSMHIEDARTLLPPETWIGISAHSASSTHSKPPAPGADFIILGTIYDSASHPGRRGAGIALVTEAAALCSVPLIAIGGITPARATQAVAAGAYGVAVLGGVWHAAEPVEAAAEYVSTMKGA